MQHGQPGYGASERHVQTAQAVRLAGCDAARLGEHDMIELKALGQRDRDDRKPGLALDRCSEPSTANSRPVARSAAADIRDLRVGADDGDRAGRSQSARSARRPPVGRARPRARALPTAPPRPAAATPPAAARARWTAAAWTRSRGSAAAPGSPRRARARRLLACRDGSAGGPGRGRPRRRALGDVAEHGRRSGGAPSSDRAASPSATGPAPRRPPRAPGSASARCRSAASSISTRSARLQRAEPGPRGGGDQTITSCSASDEQPARRAGPAPPAIAAARTPAASRPPSATPASTHCAHRRRSAAPRRASGRRRSPRPPPSGCRITCAIRCPSSSRPAP